MVYNSSYRKIIDTKNYREYNLFNIDVPAIEENMTELLLKNKKLLDKEIIIRFKYNYIIFDNQVTDLITTFKRNYKTKELSSDDKIVINNFIKNYKGNLNIYKNIIDDFMFLIEYLKNIKKIKQDNDNNIKAKTKIVEILKNIDFDVSNEFLTIFDETSELIVNKIFKIFNYYLLMILPEIKGEIRNYQEITEFEIGNKLENNLSPKLNEYFQKQHIINKEDLEDTIRLFITLVLFREKDKENKLN